MIEPEKIIEIGKYKIDISNISVKRKRIASRDYNRLQNYKLDENGEVVFKNGQPLKNENNKKISEKKAIKELLRISLYLVRQDFLILNRRFKFKTAVKEYFKRYFINIRYIETLTTKQMNSLVEWTYEELMGVKKKVENLINPLMQELDRIAASKTDEQLQLLTKFLLMSLQEQVGEWEKSQVTPKI